MAHPLSRLGYGIGQGARVAWYASHYLALNRMRGPLVPPDEKPLVPPDEKPVSIKGPIPKWQGVVARMRDLFVQDWKNIEAGLWLRYTE